MIYTRPDRLELVSRPPAHVPPAANQDGRFSNRPNVWGFIAVRGASVTHCAARFSHREDALRWAGREWHGTPVIDAGFLPD